MQWRLFTLACLLGGEILIASLWFDGETLAKSEGPRALLGQWGAWVLRWAVGFAALFCTFAYLRHAPALTTLSTREPVRWWALVGHAAALFCFLTVSWLVYGPAGAGSLGVLAWVILAAAVASSAAWALIPWEVWRAAGQITGSMWLYTAGASAIACAMAPLVRGLWEPTTRATFWLVHFLLSHLLTGLVVDPGRMRIGTPAFRVIISPECSGLEGLGLLLIFGLVWLIVFRAELRFPQALVLLPAGMVVLYLSNSVRIAALVLLGDAGWKEIARRGFHSQAGWIAFNLVAFGLSIGARRWSWVSKRVSGPSKEADEEYPAAPYLMPLLAILAAGMLAGAMSGGFEWLYGLRVLACLGALWCFRHRYAQVDWRCGWLSVVVGVMVFAWWIWGAGDARTMPAALAAASPWLKTGWILLRLAGGVLVVPIAEELAFRGFGFRRLVDADFELVSWQAFSLSALLISSLLFGLMHGDRWIAGTAAGIVYALAMRWQGRLGDAILAHAVTNGLLAFWVLWFGRWELW